jgi:hypothetical protein
MSLVTLKEGLANWTDRDVAAYKVGVTLGIFEDVDFATGWPRNRGVFLTNNVIGNGLHEVLRTLATSGVLERRRDQPDEQFRRKSKTRQP